MVLVWLGSLLEQITGLNVPCVSRWTRLRADSYMQSPASTLCAHLFILPILPRRLIGDSQMHRWYTALECFLSRYLVQAPRARPQTCRQSTSGSSGSTISGT